MDARLRTLAIVVACCFSLYAVCARAPSQPQPAPSDAETEVLLDRVIANQKKDDLAQMTFERIERQEFRKLASDPQPSQVKIFRAVPAGTGVDRITLGADGKPGDLAAYRAELKQLERALALAAEGHEQREDYEKFAKRQKDRADLIEATRTAFHYTFADRERVGERLLAKYRVDPNPNFKPANRAAAIFSKVHGHIWIDEGAAELARADVEVTENVAIVGILAKIYKGSHFMQERYEVAPEVWLPSFSQQDFDGRKFFMAFAIHERTFFSQYRRIGSPKEALQAIREELSHMTASNADP
jgi:hypothetical protein